MSGKVILGFIIFFFGLGLLLDQVGVINFGSFVSTWWPLVFILLGVGDLFSSTKSKLGAIIFLILGSSFLLVTTSTIDRNILSFIWPIILIIIGLWLMLPFTKKSIREKVHVENQIDYNTFFNYQNIKLESKDLIGGQISSLFAGLEIDLTKAELAQAGATIEINIVFSGVEIIVPKNWKIKSLAKSIFGGIENQVSEIQDDETSDLEPVLTIKGAIIFSGVEIKGK